MQLLLLACLITALSAVLPVRIPARTLSSSKPKPHTTGRELALRLRDLVPRGHAKNVKVFRDGTVEAVRQATLTPTVECPAMPFTAMAMVWDQHGRGALSARVQAGQDQNTLGESATLEDES